MLLIDDNSLRGQLLLNQVTINIKIEQSVNVKIEGETIFTYF